ncbi:MAG TPA: hypothetical protein ENJ37_09360 [Deltaproteobacteria bacterium]|nr:hypothetical protein [Deltaproteobacteria bacterium]
MKGAAARSGAAAALLVALVSGCGYHVAGKGGEMPGGVKSLAIPYFSNETARPGIETVITSAVIDEFLHVVRIAEPPEAEAVMEGAVTGYELRPMAYTGSDVTQEYRLVITMSIRIVSAATGKVLWRDDRIRDYEDFTVDAADVTATKEAELRVLEKMAADTARLIKERILEDF